MTEHSEPRQGGVQAGKMPTLRGTDLALCLCGIILLILHILQKPMWVFIALVWEMGDNACFSANFQPKLKTMTEGLIDL